jgi:GTP-binding protein YchF
LSRNLKSGDKDVLKENEVALRIKDGLEQGKSARALEFDEKEEEIVKKFQLITSKPVMYLCNVDEASVKTGNKYVDQVREAVKDENAEVLVIGAKIEADITELETYEERQMFLEELGLEEPGVNRLIISAYSLLDLQTYFTVGVKEVRAWTITKGMTAPQAAGVIHTDFEKGFIRAEVMKYNDFTTLGSEAAVKEAGKFKVEGKEYVVEDGDIMHFRFNV